jgi:membrane carboxypeptidase/penicillin-binding protein PbpC
LIKFNPNIIYRFIKIFLFLIFFACALYAVILGLWVRASASDLIELYPRNPNVVELPNDYVKMILKVEDPTFYQHIGVDISIGQGMTTLTSVVAKDIFLFGAKLKGFKGAMQIFYRGVFTICQKRDLGLDLMALILNQHLSKNEQLDFFLANVYMGSNKRVQIRGLEQASAIYFSKPLAAISRPEMITLIAMLNKPNYYHPFKNPKALKRRSYRIARLLAGECSPSGWFDTDYAGCGL